MIVMIPLAKGNERYPPAISARIELPVRLLSPKMADGINAKGRVEDRKGSTNTCEEETSDSADPIAIQQPNEKRQGQARDHDGNIVSVLPHHDAVLSQTRGIFVVGPWIVIKQPPAVAIPKSPLRIVGVQILIAVRVVADMVGRPFER